MKKLALLVFLYLFSNLIHAQSSQLLDGDLKRQLDSVLVEGNLLYKYEKASWISTDLAFSNPIVKSNFHSYLTYEIEREFRTIILDENYQNCVAEYVYEDDFDEPKSIKIEKRALSSNEKTLIDAREKIFKSVVKPKYGVSVPDGYSLNYILVPFGINYKLYIITGTSQRNVIPFGNDYVFIANKKGKIKRWQKFHSRLLPGYTEKDGSKAVDAMHTHLVTTPLMTATDICTFMLYAPLYDMNTFSVYSSALGIYMKYSLKENEITIKEKF